VKRFIGWIDIGARFFVFGSLVWILWTGERALPDVIVAMGLLVYLGLDRCADALVALKDRMGVSINVSGDVRLSDD
jgi:hypothetical protein